tara:strand:+ start:269 stop:517 length:249 start_codon:yes stop_codon:yes gene_type:complete
MPLSGHPAYSRYPWLKDRREMSRKVSYHFAWLPTRTLNSKLVWLTKLCKTTYTTRRNGVKKETWFYETFSEVAQRKLSAMEK